jgi:lipoprotein-releasing system permease protein
LISFFLAKRYLLASRRDAQVGVVALAAFLGLALGVAALVVSLALLAGFQTHVRSRLLAETPHLLVTPAGRDAFHDVDRIGTKLAAVPGVVSVSPIVRGRVWVSMGRDAAPAEIVGREKTKGLVLDVLQARPLGIVPGETVTLVSSRSRLSPLGPVPIVSTLKVTGLAPSATGRRAAEASLPLDEARRLFALGPDGATGYEVFLKDPSRAEAGAAAVIAALGPSVTLTTWEEQNRALVLALRLERFVLFAAVFLIVIVAGLNLAATSAVLAATRARDAAVLSVLGASPKTVEKVFRTAGGCGRHPRRGGRRTPGEIRPRSAPRTALWNEPRAVPRRPPGRVRRRDAFDPLGVRRGVRACPHGRKAARRGGPAWRLKRHRCSSPRVSRRGSARVTRVSKSSAAFHSPSREATSSPLPARQALGSRRCFTSSRGSKRPTRVAWCSTAWTGPCSHRPRARPCAGRAWDSFSSSITSCLS